MSFKGLPSAGLWLMLSADEMWLPKCNQVASWEGISLRHEPVKECNEDKIQSCLLSAGTRWAHVVVTPGMKSWVDVGMRWVSPKTGHFFALLGGSHWPQTVSGTEIQPAAEPVFLCASVSCLQKALCMLQTVWVSSPGSWASKKPACHRHGKQTRWKRGFVRAIIQVGPSSMLVQNHPLPILTSASGPSAASNPARPESLTAFRVEE